MPSSHSRVVRRRHRGFW
ncbi:hypothetical protein LINPERHAP1_LOCUS38743 [Linum perenne]